MLWLLLWKVTNMRSKTLPTPPSECFYWRLSPIPSSFLLPSQQIIIRLVTLLWHQFISQKKRLKINELTSYGNVILYRQSCSNTIDVSKRKASVLCTVLSRILKRAAWQSVCAGAWSRQLLATTSITAKFWCKTLLKEVQNIKQHGKVDK